MSPLTAQRTAPAGAPASVATNATRPRTGDVAIGGVIASSPNTRKTALDVTEPNGDVTVMGAVVAPGGTAATSRFGAAATRVATRSPKNSEFCAMPAANPRPNTCTVVPTTPAEGANSEIATPPGGPVGSNRSMRRMLPTAS